MSIKTFQEEIFEEINFFFNKVAIVTYTDDLALLKDHFAEQAIA